MNKKYVDLNEILLALPKDAAKIIEDWPVADVREVKQGKWVSVNEQPYFRKHYHTMVCSECGKRKDGKWNYCPNCGADMRGKKNE